MPDDEPMVEKLAMSGLAALGVGVGIIGLAFIALACAVMFARVV